MKSIVFLSCLLFSTSVLSEKYKRTYKLELVQALFRHGDRTPDKEEVYKTDPYDPEYYVPPGYGQLTNIGMQREYEIGQLLRKRYTNFIGKYTSKKVYAYSTNYDRTKASLQLVLAGLFRPTSESAWDKDLMWTPIPTYYQSFDSDFLMSSIKGWCGNIEHMQPAAMNLPEIQERMANYKDFLNYVKNKTEISDTSILNVFSVISNLLAIRSMNLPLPKWCSEEDFEKLTDIMAIFFKSLTITSELRKQIAGPIVKQLLDNTKNHKQDDEMKIYLYSGHDVNVASFTAAHNFTGIPAVPEFGSTVIIEKLRGSDNESYVRMYFWTGVGKKLIKLKLEKCDCVCPLSTYEKIVEPLLPDPELVECISRNLNCSDGSSSKAINLNPIDDNDDYVF